MTRERIVGFMFGVSLGTVIGFYLRPPDEQSKNTNHRARGERKGVAAIASSKDTRWQLGETPAHSHAAGTRL